ncbi:hypothetical protein EC973_007621 [Apophysomyces ossiformis]|uniref:Uncharacterized protein n=1 Tax=Apophysomyces ossiformis TaxID=679940 RepID=A0A8H7EU39_9FUNG|nr:hypothetical protein EC973_007621 [Apophysomyces ossiformis]
MRSIMDCQEWKDKDLSEGYRAFVKTLDKYPTAVATRCFAFDPTETQADDTKGLIMIPNVGNMSFYMSTMICDFASEILNQFSAIAGRIERLQMLESPIMLHQRSEYKIVPQPSSSSPGPTELPRHNRASHPPPIPQQSTSSSFLKRASTTTVNSRSPKFSPATPPPVPSMTRSTSAQGIASQDIGKTKRRTPGRIKKLLADFYLLAGRLPDAVTHYNQAIEMTRSQSDHLWYASAMEGLVCATILLEYLRADVGHLVSRQQISPTSISSDTPPQNPDASGTPPAPQSTIAEVVDQYTSIVQHYVKVNTTSAIPLPGLVYVEACAKLSRFLLTVHMNGGWNDHVLSLLVQGKVQDASNEKHQQRMPTGTPLTCLKSGIKKYDIAEWVMKIWAIELDDLILMDQINLLTYMATVLSTIGYHRKSAWMMYECVNRMLPLLIQSRATLASARDQSKKPVGKSDDGILEVMRRICEVFGIGERNVHDGGALEASHGGSEKTKETGVRGAVAKELVRFGWPALQIDILRQCIAIAEALPDYASMLYYTTVLLKNMYQHISKEEQMRLASSIQRIVAMGKRTGQVESNVNYWGVNIVQSIEAVHPIPRKAVYPHPMISNAITVTTKDNSDPFIYNPFAQKKNEQYQVTLVRDELCEFKVTLLNPFGFDLEVQHAALSTSGVAFNAISASATIPANGSLALRLSGVPEETGLLTIRGCFVKIVGFVEQEFLANYEEKLRKDKKGPKDESKRSTFVKFKHSGLKGIQSIRGREKSDELKPIKYYELNVIDDQPLLKIKSTSLLHGAVMLYEGEMTHISITLENIGNIPVDFITLSFTDSTTTNPLLVNPELPQEEQYEIELFTKGTHVFSWEGSTNEASQIIGKKVWLPPGGQSEVLVGVYGKRGCTGGTIQVEYGYLDRAVAEESKEQATMFYTRQLYLPVLVTVYQNLEPSNWDVLYLRHNEHVSEDRIEHALQNIQILDTNQQCVAENHVEDLLLVTRQVHNDIQNQNDYCLVTLDVRNAWTVAFNIEFNIDNDDEKETLKSVLTIQPGCTRRVMLPVKRCFLPSAECLQPIPSFEPNKQFVVSQAPKMPPQQERARLQMFWYREHLLKHVKATWRCNNTGRHGILSLRSSLRLTPLQLSILKKEDIEFGVDVLGNGVTKTGHRRFRYEGNDFVNMKISIRNRHVHPVKLILRIQPVQSYNDGAKEYDLSGKLLMQGLQQVVLPEIRGNDQVDYELSLGFLSRGQFEFIYHAEDVHTREVYYDHEWAIVDVLKATDG